MKIFEDKGAPNPRRVRIFLAEKGISVPYEQVVIMQGQHKSDEHRQRNFLAQLPVLQLDDGTYISESVAICRYFEEVHPHPPLMGTDAKDKAIVEMWQRRLELALFMPIAQAFRHTHPAMASLETQIKEWGELNRERSLNAIAWLDREIGGKPFITGERYTIADITTLVSLDFARAARVKIPDECANVKRWYQAVSTRPSAQA